VRPDGIARRLLPVLCLAFFPCAYSQPSSCTLAPDNSAVELGSDGTASPGGFVPEIPQTVTITAMGNCGALTVVAQPAYIGPGLCGMPTNLPNHWLMAGSSGNAATFVALSNLASAPRTATITISSASGAGSSFTVTEGPDSENSSDRFVRALYQAILGRDPDSSGFAFWTGAGATGLSMMADSFLTSPEAFNTDFAVMAAYQAGTGAAPTYAQFWTAVSSIRAGTETVATLYTSLLGSNSTANAATVATLYRNLLSRNPLPSEIQMAEDAGPAPWFETLIGYPATITNAAPAGAVANEFQSTGAFHTDHTNGLYIALLYYVILGRDYDLPGYDYWVGVANSGGPGILFQGQAAYPARIEILGTSIVQDPGFVFSPEFFGPSSCPLFG